MIYSNSKTFMLFVFCTAGICFAACNSNNSSNTTSDTSNAMYSPATADTTSMNNAMSDTSAMANTSADTSTAQKSTTSTGTSTSKKKGKATVTLMPEVKNKKVQMDKAGIYDYSEVMPSFPGGESAIENYVTNNIQYTDDALNAGTEGKVNVAFTVDETGKISDAHTVSSKLGDGLDEEAIRVVSSMPKWKPGTVKGEAVKARMTLPITFQIQ